MSYGLIFSGAAETLGFGGAFLMASGRDGAVTTVVLAGIPVGSTVVAFEPAGIRRGRRVGIA